LPGAKIVWVGGKDADRETLSAIITASPLGELSFATVPEALEMVKKRSLDVLLVDVSQAGADVLALLQAASPNNGRRASRAAPRNTSRRRSMRRIRCSCCAGYSS